MGAPEVTAFLSGLAARGVSASTQNQALSWMNDIVRAQRSVRLPVVLSREEVAWQFRSYWSVQPVRDTLRPYK
jgi:hypothetical protein